MYRMLVSLLVAFSSLAFADMTTDMVAKVGDITIVLHKEDCKIEELSQSIMAAGGLSQPMSLTISKGNFEIHGCWSIDQENHVLIGDELGDTGYLLTKQFKPVEII